MSYCSKCGNNVPDDARFCGKCGAEMVENQTVGSPVFTEQFKLEKEFLDNTHKILRWEQKAWRIVGRVFTIMGAIFGGFFTLFTFVGLSTHAAMGMIFFIYALIFGGLYIAIGIVSLQAAKKIDYYLNTLYKNVEPTVTRCTSVGMLIFAIFFNTIAMVFFVINFSRMKNCKQRIADIQDHQRRMR